MNAIDSFRFQVLRHISTVKSFHQSWTVFGNHIDQTIGTTPTAQQIFTLGENLSKVFRSNSASGRSQSAVASGGAAWECLVAWYFNLIFHGTNVIATRQHQRFVPSVLYDSFCVTIANHKTNTESDIVVYSIPNADSLLSMSLDDIDELIRSDIRSVNTAIVQCKTNWNDNAQIPMLWDLIYNSTSFRIPNVYVGTNGVSPNSFGTFSYSFVTVPSNDDTYSPSSVSVLRVKNLTGGNYWGHPTQQGVANAICNFFGRNFRTHFNGSVQSHITNQFATDPTIYRRYRNLDF
jgi:hypothetical protein